MKYLKIDIEFVKDLAKSQRDRAVVSAIVTLARGFGGQTIAEGVEDHETAAVLRSLGVTYAQGYVFGAPAPLTDGRLSHHRDSLAFSRQHDQAARAVSEQIEDLS